MAKTMHISSFTLDDEKVILANSKAITRCLWDWVPVHEWERFLTKLEKENVHWTMQEAAHRMLHANTAKPKKRTWA